MQTNVLGISGVFADPDIHGGQPIVETGIPIYLILDMLSQEFSRQDMLQDYGITEEHIQLALKFAAEYMKRQGLHAA